MAFNAVNSNNNPQFQTFIEMEKIQRFWKSQMFKNNIWVRRLEEKKLTRDGPTSEE